MPAEADLREDGCSHVPNNHFGIETGGIRFHRMFGLGPVDTITELIYILNSCAGTSTSRRQGEISEMTCKKAQKCMVTKNAEAAGT